MKFIPASELKSSHENLLQLAVSQSEPVFSHREVAPNRKGCRYRRGSFVFLPWRHIHQDMVVQGLLILPIRLSDFVSNNKSLSKDNIIILSITAFHLCPMTYAQSTETSLCLADIMGTKQSMVVGVNSAAGAA